MKIARRRWEPSETLGAGRLISGREIGGAKVKLCRSKFRRKVRLLPWLSGRGEPEEDGRQGWKGREFRLRKNSSACRVLVFNHLIQLSE